MTGQLKISSTIEPGVHFGSIAFNKVGAMEERVITQQMKEEKMTKFISKLQKRFRSSRGQSMSRVSSASSASDEVDNYGCKSSDRCNQTERYSTSPRIKKLVSDSTKTNETRQEDDDQQTSDSISCCSEEPALAMLDDGTNWNGRTVGFECVRQMWKAKDANNLPSRSASFSDTQLQTVDLPCPFGKNRAYVHGHNISSESSYFAEQIIAIPHDSGREAKDVLVYPASSNLNDGDKAGAKTFPNNWYFRHNNKVHTEILGRKYYLNSNELFRREASGSESHCEIDESLSLESFWTSATEDLNSELVGKTIIVNYRPACPFENANGWSCDAGNCSNKELPLYKRIQARVQAAVSFLCQQLHSNAVGCGATQCFDF